MPTVLMNTDVVNQVMLHLRPRQVYKLIQVNKELHAKVFQHKYYWNRVAVHCLYDFYVATGEFKHYVRMKNIPWGYNDSMDHFLKLTLQYVNQYGVNATTAAEAVTRYNEVVRRKWEMGDNEACIYEKELTTFNVIKISCKAQGHRHDWNKVDAAFFQLSNDLEDDSSLSIETKKRVANKMREIFAFEPQEGSRNPGGDLFSVEAAMDHYRKYLQYRDFFCGIREHVWKWVVFVNTEETISTEMKNRLKSVVIEALTFQPSVDMKMFRAETVVTFHLSDIYEVGSFAKKCVESIDSWMAENCV
jgi:hypothetical protein